MAHVVKWQRSGRSAVNIGHEDQKGFTDPIDSDGLRRYSIRLFVLSSTRDNYETAIESLQDTLRIRPMVIKTTNFGRKYIVPNGSQGYLITSYDTIGLIYPESIGIEPGDQAGSTVTVTFVKALS